LPFVEFGAKVLNTLTKYTAGCLISNVNAQHFHTENVLGLSAILSGIQKRSFLIRSANTNTHFAQTFFGRDKTLLTNPEDLI
jgi:hypothetical protein